MAIKTVEEWMAHGQPNTLGYVKFPVYSHVWYSDRMYNAVGRQEGLCEFTAEDAARLFVSRMKGWTVGPKLSHRTVTYSDWEEVEINED